VGEAAARLPGDHQGATLEATINSQIALNKANTSALKELREKFSSRSGGPPTTS
jgi:hypothetical protein